MSLPVLLPVLVLHSKFTTCKCFNFTPTSSLPLTVVTDLLHCRRSTFNQNTSHYLSREARHKWWWKKLKTFYGCLSIIREIFYSTVSCIQVFYEGFLTSSSYFSAYCSLFTLTISFLFFVVNFYAVSILTMKVQMEMVSINTVVVHICVIWCRNSSGGLEWQNRIWRLSALG